MQAGTLRILQRAVARYNAGRLEDAEGDARRVLAEAPADPSALNIVGAIAMQRGDLPAALELFASAARQQPQNPFLQFNLGEAYRRQSAFQRAVPHYRKALALKSDLVEAHALTGECLRALGRSSDARRAYRAALSRGPNATAYAGLAMLALETEDLPAARGWFEFALSAAPKAGEATGAHLLNLGQTCLRLGDHVVAQTALAKAATLAPGLADAWWALARSLRHARVLPEGPVWRDLLLAMFDRPDVNPRSLTTAALAVIRDREDFALLLDAMSGADSDALKVDQAWGGVCAIFDDDLTGAYLRNAPVTDPALEFLTTSYRARLLRDRGRRPAARLADLAQQSWLNEYAFQSTPDEERLLDALAQRPDLSWEEAALFGAYRPLADLRLDWDAAPDWFAGIVRRQITDVAEEQVLVAATPRLREATDPVSVAVQQQYEANPFPRWTQVTGSRPIAYAAAIRAAQPHLRSGEVKSLQTPRILVAGAGTGLEPMRVAATYADARILAVDLSVASLAYSARKAREYGLDNIEHLQADILDLRDLGRTFDMVTSFGVLHHMADPAAGLRALHDVLEPGGLVALGLYSEAARTSVVAARAMIQDRAYEPTLQGVRQARRDILREGPEGPRADLTSPASDFWTTSDCRDLLFHVQEHRFNFLQVADLFADAGLEFLGAQLVNAGDQAAFKAMFPDSDSVRSPSAWHAFETANPQVFGDTYRLWGRRPRRTSSGG